VAVRRQAWEKRRSKLHHSVNDQGGQSAALFAFSFTNKRRLQVSPSLLILEISNAWFFLAKILRDFAGSGVKKTVALKPGAEMNKPRDKNNSKLTLWSNPIASLNPSLLPD
jgi:hypothetical protein